VKTLCDEEVLYLYSGNLLVVDQIGHIQPCYWEVTPGLLVGVRTCSCQHLIADVDDEWVVHPEIMSDGGKALILGYPFDPLEHLLLPTNQWLGPNFGRNPLDQRIGNFQNPTSKK